MFPNLLHFFLNIKKLIDVLYDYVVIEIKINDQRNNHNSNLLFISL